jgi:hypothetical protein
MDNIKETNNNEETEMYYQYKDLKLYNTKILETPYETKLKIIPDVIYPEYKKGRKLHELANYYKIEQYLIEDYIRSIEIENNDLNTDIEFIKIMKRKENINDNNIINENNENNDNKYAVFFSSKILSLEYNYKTLEHKFAKLENKLDEIIKKMN